MSYAAGMLEHRLYAMLFIVPGTAAASVALQASVALSAAYAGLRLKAAEQNRDVPPLAAVYFRNAVRVLFVTGAGFFLAAGADVLVSAFSDMPAGLLGYTSGAVLLVCGFGLLLHGRTDGHLKLLRPRERLLHTLAGLVGILAAAWGMVLVTWKGTVWP